LVLSGLGRSALAAGELRQAELMGIDPRRVAPRLEAVMEAGRAG
jgi:hypothetical protein